MTKQNPIFSTIYYALNWGYGRGTAVLLKYLHANPDIPFKISGIIHDDPWVPEVDGVPLISTKDFIGKKHMGPVALIAIGPYAQGMWDSMPTPKPPLFSMPDITRRVAEAMQGQRLRGVPIGPMLFPDVFDGQDKLSPAVVGCFGDELSRQVYMRYLEFLQQPQWSCFEPVISPPNTNCFDPEWFVLSCFMDRRRPSCVIEIADRQTSFPEQFVGFMGPQGKYFLWAPAQGAVRHHALLDGIRPDFLEIISNVGQVPSQALTDTTTILIVNAQQVKHDPEKLRNIRIIMRAGDSANNFRAALDLSLAAHPYGERSLRISGRYPNSLFLFSSPAAA